MQAAETLEYLRSQFERLETKARRDGDRLQVAIGDLLTTMESLFQGKQILRIPSDLSIGSLEDETYEEDLPWEPQRHSRPENPTRTSVVRKEPDPDIRDESVKKQLKQQNANRLRRRVTSRRRSMLRAQEALDKWQEHYHNELDRYKRYKDTSAMSLTDFNLRMLQNHQKAVEKCERKEAAWMDARIEARDSGVDLNDSDQESLFPDFSEDGRFLQLHDGARIKSVDRERIEDWRRGSKFRKEYSEDVDDWEVESLVMGDSCSILADERERVRIDRWKASCQKMVEKSQQADYRFGKESVPDGIVWRGHRSDRCPLSHP